MTLNPEKICEEFENHNLDKQTAFDLLISLIENSENENIRVKSIENLEKIGIFNAHSFTILENILISDSNENVRNAAATIIQKRFTNEKALDPLKWAIKHESNYECLITIIKTLVKINNKEAKAILFEQLKGIRKTKYLNRDKNVQNKRFRKTLKILFKERKYEDLIQRELGEILINYLTICHLIEQFPNVYYELDPKTALIKELDLSDYMEYEVKGTPWGWKNNIKNITDITGLFNLKNLEKIDLSNNQITNIKELIQLANLRYLNLTNNKISDLVNINYLKTLPNLEYLDLRGNKIAKKIRIDRFYPKIRVILDDSYIKIK
ncbi:MAG: leucine-rich repeat domain-containing protein [Candidatus Hodarchaeota archaeon]